MTTMRRLQPDEVMSDVVRRRLESLVQERAPGRLMAVGRPAAPPTAVAAGSPPAPEDARGVPPPDDGRNPPTPDDAGETPAPPPVIGGAWRRTVERGVDFGKSHLAVVLIIAVMVVPIQVAPS